MFKRPKVAFKRYKMHRLDYRARVAKRARLK